MTRDRPDLHRRSLLTSAAALAGAAAAPVAVARTADLTRPAMLTVFDPDEPAARAFAASRGGASLAIRGDRVRLAQRVFTDRAPDRLTVVARHADLILLTDAAREHGYRRVAEAPFPALDGRGGIYIWTAQRPGLARRG